MIDPDPDEIVERSRQTNTTFVKRNEDNTMQFSATSEGAPVNFEDENGEWQPYNTTLVPSEKADYDWQLGASDHQAYFKNTLSQSPAIRIEKEGKFITMHPNELQYMNQNGETQIVSAPKSTAQATVKDNVITYKNAYGPGIDLIFTIEPVEIKKEVVIHTKDTLPQPTFNSAYLEINLDINTSQDLHIFTQQKGDSKDIKKSEWNRDASIITQGIIEFRDTNPDNNDRNYDGEVNEQDLTLLQFLPAVAYDSSEQQQFINSDEDDMILALQNKDSQSAVSVQTPYSWLENAVYPVTIDPTAGPNNPSSTSQVDGCVGCSMPDWNNPSNVYTSNNVRATANMAGPAGSMTSYSKVLSITGYGFNLPTNTVVINGIQVGIERMASTANRIRFDHVRLLNGSANQNLATTTAWPTTEAYQNFGSTSNLWGGTWTRTNINSSSFGVRTQAFFYQGVSGSVTASIDHVRVTVTYTVNTPPSINLSPSVNYGSFTRLGPSNTPVNVSFRATDAEQTGINQLSYQIRTSSAINGGTLVGSGNARSGITVNHSLANTAPGLTEGSQTLYVRFYDGYAWSNASSFTLLRDISAPTASSISHSPIWVGPSKQYAVFFTPSDTYSTSANEITWWIRTGAGGGGTELATGNTTQGAQRTTGTFTDSGLSSGNNPRYLRINDGANNIYETSFTVQHDGTDPTAPSGLSSSSHTPSTWSTQNVITMNWTASTDAHSGLSGYSYIFDNSPTTNAPTVQNLGVTTTVTSDPLQDGRDIYFHIRAQDNAGNWGPTAHYGPFHIDTSEPTTTSSTFSPIPITSSKQYTVSFIPTDAVATGLNELSYQIRTESGGSGSLLASGNATSGNQVTTSTITDSTLVHGRKDNWRYLRIIDLAGNVHEVPLQLASEIPFPTPTPRPTGSYEGFSAEGIRVEGIRFD